MSSSISFRISGIEPVAFAKFFEMTDSELAAQGARRCIVDSRPGFPCRVSLEDGQLGEEVILAPYVHHPVNGPYRASGPIYVRVAAKPAQLKLNEVPQVVRERLMSVRAYDAEGTMLGSNVTEGSEIEKQIEFFLTQPTVAYLHLHNAKAGCYSCRVDRA